MPDHMNTQHATAAGQISPLPTSTAARADGTLTVLYGEKSLPILAEEYISLCKESPKEGEGGKSKTTARFPNLAGFCRYLGCGLDTLEAIREESPTEFSALLAILEDEALNFLYSPTLVAAYLKRRMEYEKEKERKASGYDAMQICFEHDVLEDGE